MKLAYFCAAVASVAAMPHGHYSTDVALEAGEHAAPSAIEARFAMLERKIERQQKTIEEQQETNEKQQETIDKQQETIDELHAHHRLGKVPSFERKDDADRYKPPLFGTERGTCTDTGDYVLPTKCDRKDCQDYLPGRGDVCPGRSPSGQRCAGTSYRCVQCGVAVQNNPPCD